MRFGDFGCNGSEFAGWRPGSLVGRFRRRGSRLHGDGGEEFQRLVGEKNLFKSRKRRSFDQSSE